MASEPKSAAAAGSENRSEPAHSLSHFPARPVGDLSSLARFPRPAPTSRRPERRWVAGVTILLPRPNQLGDSRGEHSAAGPRTALTVAELSVVLTAAACAWPGTDRADSVELEVLALQIRGVAPACYRYQPVRHALLPSGEAQLRLVQAQLRPVEESYDRGNPPVPNAALLLTIRSPGADLQSSSAGDLGVGSAVAAARLAVRLITNAAVTAAADLGLISYSCLSQGGLGCQVGIGRPIGPQSA